MSVPRAAAEQVRALSQGGEEFAILDVREEGTFARGHLLLAASCPLGRLEVLIGAKVPRRSTKLLLVDADGADAGPAARAAAVLQDLGYTDCSIIEGGMNACQAAGLGTFTGVHVISKAFGELVVEYYGTPMIAPADLQARLSAGDDLVVLDSRPWDEFRRMSIPGGIDVPGADLVYRAGTLAPSPDTLVVVNCAGRTRSIIGAQSLINAGIPNPVLALEGGTMAWELAGFTAPPGERAHVSAIEGPALARAIAESRNVAAHWGVTEIDADALARLQAEAAERTTYLFDVRLPEEYGAGHLPGAVSAPGGQLVQETDRYAPVRNARIVLADDEAGVRGRMTGAWLRQMGWREVLVLKTTAEARSETAPPPIPRPSDDVPEISTAAVQELSARGGGTLIDLSLSPTRKAGHVPSSVFALRAKLAEKHARLAAAAKPIVLISEHGSVAAWAARELARSHGIDAQVMTGGIDAWRAAGLPLESGMGAAWDEPVDVHPKPYDHERDVAEHMKAYLSWEVDLPGRVAADGTVRFNLSE